MLHYFIVIKIILGVNTFSKNNKALKNEKKMYLEKNKILNDENINLKKEVEKLKPLVEKLILSSNKLELILKK